MTPFNKKVKGSKIFAGFNAGAWALNDRRAFLAQMEVIGSRQDLVRKTAKIYMGMPVQAGTWGEHSPERNYVVSRQAGEDLADDKGRATKQQGHRCGVWNLLYRDYRRHRTAGARNAFSVVVLTQGFWASAVFRVSQWALTRCRVPGLRTVVNAICILAQKFIEILTGICVPGRCIIGPGLYIGHFGGIFIDSEARMGENCNVAQGVTIGKGGRGELQGVPILGDRVHIGAHAVILGKISIGDDAVIGPGAVVMNPVPPRGVAMGNPARIVGTSGSFEFVHYDGMENDPARRMSLENLQAASGGDERRNPLPTERKKETATTK